MTEDQLEKEAAAAVFCLLSAVPAREPAQYDRTDAEG